MDFRRRAPPKLGSLPSAAPLATPAAPKEDASNGSSSYFSTETRATAESNSLPHGAFAPVPTPFNGPPTIHPSKSVAPIMDQNAGFAAALSGQSQAAAYLSPMPSGLFPVTSNTIRDSKPKAKRPSGLSAYPQPPSSPANKSDSESPLTSDIRSLSFEGRSDKSPLFAEGPKSTSPKRQHSMFNLNAPPLPSQVPSKRTHATPPKSASAPTPTQNRHKNARIVADKYAAVSQSELDKLLARTDSGESTLIIDIRPHTKFVSQGQGHLQNSINLCAPTTLLRRAAFGLDRLADTLPDAYEKERFLSAGTSDSAVQVIIGVDQDSTALFDDSPLCSLLTKFEKAGFQGELKWVHGGYQCLQQDPAFMERHRHPEEADYSSSLSSSPSSNSLHPPNKRTNSSSSSSSGSASSSLVSSFTGSALSKSGSFTSTSSGSSSSVINARLLPGQAFDSRSTQAHILGKNAETGVQQQCANPFFDTIRQNHEVLSLESSMSNVIDVHLRPECETPQFIQQLPACLRSLAELKPRQRGEKLAHEFYLVEAAEQKRLQEVLAWSAQVRSADEPDHPFGISAGMEKGHLNRYKNIFPYEHARCRLQKHDPAATDYINASHVRFKDDPSKSYIASQGPMPATYEDFWQLVDQENAGVVVMLTNLTEGGREKCGKYYVPGQYGRFEISCPGGEVHIYPGEDQTGKTPGSSSGFFSSFDLAASSKTTPRAANSPSVPVCRSTLALKKPDGSVRAVKHIKFAGWPDFDVPPDAEALLDLINEVNQAKQDIAKQNNTSVGPVVVHCSAGVGRTGSYMLVDVLLDMYEKARQQQDPTSSKMDVDISPFAPSLECLNQPDYLRILVDEMRQHRMSMVANYAQYQFCCQAILLGCHRIAQAWQ